MAQVRKFKVHLSAEQRQRLEVLTRTGQAAAKKILHARILLMADEGHPEGRWHDEQIGRALGVHRNTVGQVRKRFVVAGEAPALRRTPRAQLAVAPKLDGEKEAHLVAICCSPPPQGRVRWTLSLLVSEVTRRGLVASICRETVRQTLKKIALSRGASSATASRSGMGPGLSPRWRTSSTSTRPHPARRSR